MRRRCSRHAHAARASTPDGKSDRLYGRDDTVVLCSGGRGMNRSRPNRIRAGEICPDVKLSLYRTLLTIRRFEEAIAEAYGEQEMRSPTHLCTGQEAVAT